MKKLIYKSCKVVFVSTLALYLVTLISVPYVGVYLTYGAIPVIIVSGILCYWVESNESGYAEEETRRDRLLDIEARLNDLEK